VWRDKRIMTAQKLSKKTLALRLALTFATVFILVFLVLILLQSMGLESYAPLAAGAVAGMASLALNIILSRTPTSPHNQGSKPRGAL
jgi:hypothetical protein